MYLVVVRFTSTRETSGENYKVGLLSCMDEQTHFTYQVVNTYFRFIIILYS